MSHLPVLLAADRKLIIGHLARANPRASILASHRSVTLVFHGLHAYISPTWYGNPPGRDIPTWNYAVVHVTGSARLVTDPPSLIEVLRAMTERFEPETADAGKTRAENEVHPSRSPWRFELPEDLTRAIVGLEIAVEKVEAKFKLSQNRRPADKPRQTAAVLHDVPVIELKPGALSQPTTHPSPGRVL